MSATDDVPNVSWGYIGKGDRMHAFQNPPLRAGCKSYAQALCGACGYVGLVKRDPVPAEKCGPCARKAQRVNP
jgi:hypothetical protein